MTKGKAQADHSQAYTVSYNVIGRQDAMLDVKPDDGTILSATSGVMWQLTSDTYGRRYGVSEGVACMGLSHALARCAMRFGRASDRVPRELSRHASA